MPTWLNIVLVCAGVLVGLGAAWLILAIATPQDDLLDQAQSRDRQGKPDRARVTGRTGT